MKIKKLDLAIIISILIIAVVLLACLGCTNTSYTTQEGVVVKHSTFLANEKVGELYFAKDNNSLHFEMGDVEISAEELALKFFQLGFTAGGGNQ